MRRRIIEGMDPRSDISANEVSDADLAEINARLDALDWNNMHFDAVPSICIEPVLLDPSAVADAELEFERQLALDTEHADNFVPAPGRIRCDCAWKLGEQTLRALYYCFSARFTAEAHAKIRRTRMARAVDVRDDLFTTPKNGAHPTQPALTRGRGRCR